MKFTADIAQPVESGKYNYQFTAGSGAATLQIKTEGASGFVNVPDGALTADSTELIELARCELKAGLTSDAEFILNRIA